MTKIVIIEKTGVVKETDIKLKDINDLYKKAGFKNQNGFQLQTTWSINLESADFSVLLYGKTEGRAGQENKYDFPPPVDDKLFFGNCVLLKKIDNEISNLTKEEWDECYENLFGGFEDIGGEDSELSEDEIGDDASFTKEGYIKDDFIVDDSELEIEDEGDEEEEDIELEETDEDEEEEDMNDFSDEDNVKKKKVAKPTKKVAPVKQKEKIKKETQKEKPTKKPKSKKETESQSQKSGKTLKPNLSSNYLNCSDELVVEEYV